MALLVNEKYFYTNGRKVFLISGEIHYFRIKRKLWSKHLAAAKEAGLRCISTYVPWDWHEPEETVFDFNGVTCPERDLLGWLKLCQENGLNCILKPGPFILAEWRGAGLPEWLLEQSGKEIKMRNSYGGIVQSDGVNLFHPVFIDKLTRWYNQIMPLVARFQSSKGGPMIMMQVCNEIGVFTWLAQQADYSKEIKERFLRYLQNKFGNIHEVNNLWGTSYNGFHDVELPPEGKIPFASKFDRSRNYEWHCFWRTCYSEYLKMLVAMIRERGINVPLYHNLPGWIYGHGYDFPLNITMYSELYGEKSEIIFGVDHIPEFMSFRNAHDDRVINDITAAMQGNKPLFAAEFQSGSREYHVSTNPREMELFYKTSLINGLAGWNYYMFSQGRNPSRKGYSGNTFYWFTPLTAEAERTSAFQVVKHMNHMVDVLENIIVGSKRKADICVVFYPPYYTGEIERPETGASGLCFDFAAIRRPAYFDGLLRILQTLNIDYDMADLTMSSAETLRKYRQVWVFGTDEMDAREQKVILDYGRNGGNMVLFPCLPEREMNQQACCILQEAVGVKPSGFEVVDSPLVDVFDFTDIKCANPQIVYDEKNLSGARIIARNIKGNICGFVKKIGKGSILHLGTWLGFDTESHKSVYEAILETSGAKLRHASSSNEFLTVRQRFTPDNKALLFVGNYFNESQEGKITYTHPQNAGLITIPYVGENYNWPALYGLLSPVCLEIAPGISILHITSDILSITVTESNIRISLHGDRDLPGEMVFEGNSLNDIDSISINGEPVEKYFHNKRLVIRYQHLHSKTMHLELFLQ